MPAFLLKMDRAKKEEIIQKVTKIAEPTLEDLGYELVDVEYVFERGRWVLRIYIDKEGGVGINDCVEVSQELSTLLDIEDPIESSYVLEVSSPGLNRPLTKEKHFIQAIGKKVKIKTENPIEGRKNFTGYLRDFKDGIVMIEVDNRIYQLERENIKKANLVYEFDDSF